jgi:plasmid stabilization system protein ParE
MLPKFEIIIKPEAENDFVQIKEWYEDSSLGLGSKFSDKFIDTLKKISNNPYYCFNVGFGYRRAYINSFPYNIFFRIENNIVIVLGIFHQHRDPEAWQERIG